MLIDILLVNSADPDQTVYAWADQGLQWMHTS